MASAQTLALGSLLAGGILAIAFAASTATTGCSTVETQPPPDASKPPCNQGPFTFDCKPAAPGQQACNTSNSKSSLVARLPQNTDYPVGCTVNFVGARDEQGDCRLEQVCKCVIGEIPGVQPEAGAPVEEDAGDDAEAGAQPQPQPQPSTTGPVWLCN